ncbi:MBL fold metallo-hydrolase [Nocardia terpenica]|uniref:Metal dependent hydrolase n=1 Tax=Nocardia terpenica TaxID=455432 RepID=A0A291RLZ0_9NOCA|nr:MBL fold metallo-hydrolase [Nocardia terpenica]ATL68174.1 metal dependent hydrolase [Nocardia terpenica]
MCRDHELLSRRSLMGAAAAVAGSAGLAAATGPAAAAAPRNASRPAPANALITLGTAAGPPIGDRAGFGTALTIGDGPDAQIYMVDCGRGTVPQFQHAGLDIHRLRALFITHLHIDHIVDYPSLLLGYWWGGQTDRPLQVYGPGSAGGLQPGPDPAAPIVGGIGAVDIGGEPGLTALTDHILAGYAYGVNVHIRSLHQPDIRQLIQAREIALPPGSNFTHPAPRMSPFPVYRDDKVTVTATLVPHHNVYPSFAFRFDLTGGPSITFSGDTVKSDNLIELASGTDILIHEAILEHEDNYSRASHTSAEDVGTVATAAEANHLILSHYYGAPPDDPRWPNLIRRHYRGRLDIARDGDVFPLPT